MRSARGVSGKNVQVQTERGGQQADEPTKGHYAKITRELTILRSTSSKCPGCSAGSSRT